MVPGERQLATVLFTDIVDSTATLERVGDARLARRCSQRTTAALRDQNEPVPWPREGHHRRRVPGHLRQCHAGPSDAAAAMTRAAEKVGIADQGGHPHGARSRSLGPDVRGVAVHTAARVLSQSPVPARSYVSATTRDLLEGSDFGFVDAGSHELKGLSGRDRCTASPGAATATDPGAGLPKWVSTRWPVPDDMAMTDQDGDGMLDPSPER